MTNRYPAGLRPTPVDPHPAARAPANTAPHVCRRCGTPLDPPGARLYITADHSEPGYLCRTCARAILHG